MFEELYRKNLYGKAKESAPKSTSASFTTKATNEIANLNNFDYKNIEKLLSDSE